MMEKVLNGSVLTEPAALQVTHYKPIGLGDYIAFGAVKFLRFFADAFFRHRYGHRAVVLETVAAVPGMVGGIQVAKPNWLERALIIIAQGIFFNGFFVFYLFWPRIAHRFVGYLEEEAVYSYTEYLAEIDAGRAENIPAPQYAIDYWHLAPDARLRDVVIVVRLDEAGHRDVNHGFSDYMAGWGVAT
jgi:ubiquinol oxidase